MLVSGQYGFLHGQGRNEKILTRSGEKAQDLAHGVGWTGKKE
jgi:hypothetical protein